ncbi:MAG: DUF3991 and TOPRIM domain-containing protein [Lachnospiraceae bacterium]|nr:DUF3991 and toprim domain-containing protein [Lachnospiraceae bacterium]MDY3221831.1 DUF3991 and TOPRIM domain-containing protein [Lachnospiraceae bacterium]
MYRQERKKPMPFTEEQMQQIYATNIIDFAVQNGFEIEKSDKATVHVKNNGGLFLFKHGRGFYSFTKEKGGDIVAFTMEYLGMEKLAAMEYILGCRAYEQTTHVVAPQEKGERGKLVLPPRDSDDRRVFAYLTKSRRIDGEIVQAMMKQGKVYQSRQEINGKIRRNCAFVGFDEEGKPRYCALRGPSVDSTFRQDIENSDKTYGFLMEGRSNRVYDFEAPIDAMSHATLCKLRGEDWRRDYRIAEGCLSDRALKRFLKQHPQVNEIVFCYDNDLEGRLADGTPHNHGQVRAAQAKDYFASLGYRVAILTPKQKDFNKMLTALYEQPTAGEMSLEEEEEQER